MVDLGQSGSSNIAILPVSTGQREGDYSALLGSLGNLYGVYSQRQAQENYFDTMRQMEQDQQAVTNQQADAEYESQVNYLMTYGDPSMLSGGGGSVRPKVTSEMIDTYKDYMNKASAALTPYSDAAKSLLPQQTAIAKQQASALSSLSDLYNTKNIYKTLNPNIPAYAVKFNLGRK